MNILTEADGLTGGDRYKAYSPPSREFASVASLWSDLLGTTVQAYQVPLCMILLKMVRYQYSQGRDSLVDIAGYARTIEMMGQE